MMSRRGSAAIQRASFRTIALLMGALLTASAGVILAWAQAPSPVPAEVASLAGRHPADYYLKAGELFKADRKDDAVFVFYLGQLRYRAHLMARPGLPPDKDAAVFASLSEVLGRPLNEYAFGDIPQLARTIDGVLAYDAGSPDGFTPPTEFPQVYAGVRGGLEKLKAQMLRDADNIRATRTKNGLSNRS